MSFNELPDDIIYEITQHLQAEDLARFFATSKALRQENYNTDLQRLVNDRKTYVVTLPERSYQLRQEIAEDAFNWITKDRELETKVEPMQVYRNWITLKSPQGAVFRPSFVDPILDPYLVGFPEYKGRRIASFYALANWMRCYLYLNNLVVAEDGYFETEFKRDALLSLLPGETNDFSGFNWMVRHSLHEIEELLPYELLEQLDFINTYTRRMLTRIRTAYTSLQEKQAEAVEKKIVDVAAYIKEEQNAYDDLIRRLTYR